MSDMSNPSLGCLLNLGYEIKPIWYSAQKSMMTLWVASWNGRLVGTLVSDFDCLNVSYRYLKKKTLFKIEAYFSM